MSKCRYCAHGLAFRADLSELPARLQGMAKVMMVEESEVAVVGRASTQNICKGGRGFNAVNHLGMRFKHRCGYVKAFTLESQFTDCGDSSFHV